MTARRDSVEPISVWAAVSSDLVQIEQLLRSVSCPVDGLRDQFPLAYVVARDDAKRVTAVAGLERYGDLGVLRSVAVAPAFRDRGIGRALVSDRLVAARGLRLSAVYLLSTAAAQYFARFGFVPVNRAKVPSAIVGSAEFSATHVAAAFCLPLRNVPMNGD